MNTQTQLLFADDHPLFREALRSVVGRLWPDALIAEADSLCAARQVMLNAPIDLLFLDLKLPDSDGFVGLVTLRAEFPQTPIVVVSATEDSATVSKAIALGAQGFIPKSAALPILAAALRSVLEGDMWTPQDVRLNQAPPEIHALSALSPAQARILLFLRRGLLNKQIAFELGVTEATVKAHMTATFRKLGVVNRTQALILAQALTGDPALDFELPA